MILFVTSATTLTDTTLNLLVYKGSNYGQRQRMSCLRSQSTLSQGQELCSFRWWVALLFSACPERWVCPIETSQQWQWGSVSYSQVIHFCLNLHNTTFICLLHFSMHLHWRKEFCGFWLFSNPCTGWVLTWSFLEQQDKVSLLLHASCPQVLTPDIWTH